jgi:hypothetical protein
VRLLPGEGQLESGRVRGAWFLAQTPARRSAMKHDKLPMKGQKSIGLRSLLGVAAIVLGLVTWFILALAWTNAFPDISNGKLGILIPISAVVVAGYLLYKWSIR